MQASRSRALLPLRLIGHFGFGAFGLIKRLLASAHAVPSLAAEPTSPSRRSASGTTRRASRSRPRRRIVPAQPCANLREGDRGTREESAAGVGAPRAALRERRKDPHRGHFGSVERGRLTAHPAREAHHPDPNPASDVGKKLFDLVETLAFDPWHACVELRPLGAAMRARNPAYRESQKARQAAKEP